MLQNGNQNGKDPQHSMESNIGNGSPSSSPRRIIAFVGGIDLTGKSKSKYCNMRCQVFKRGVQNYLGSQRKITVFCQ